MGVIPKRTSPICDEAVRELTSDRHRVLSHTGDAVHGVGDINSVPVQRDSGSNRLITQMHLNQLPLPDADLGAGRCAIDGESGDRPATDTQLLLPGHQIDPYVRRSARVRHQVGDRARRPRMVVVPVTLPVAAVPTHTGIELSATAVVQVAHLHHRIRRRHPAGLPHPSQRSHDRDGCQHR